jgi:large subunit ribosomal protein L31
MQQLFSYRPVVFLDRAASYGFVVRSTALTDKSIVWEDGRTYPLVTLDVSSASHPFYTGQQTTLDSTGRIERFRRRADRSTASGATVAESRSDSDAKIGAGAERADAARAAVSAGA